MNVKRPAILFLAAFIFGIIIAYEPVPLTFKLLLGSIAIFLYLKLIFDDKLRLITFLIIILFCVLGFLRFKLEDGIFNRYERSIASLGKGTHVLTGKVISIGKSTNSNYYIVDNCSSDFYKLGRARLYFGDELKSDVKIGNLIKSNASFIMINEPMNEGEFNQKNYYRSNGISFIAYAKDVEVVNDKYDRLRQKIYEIKLVIKDQIKKIFNKKDAGLFIGMLTGDRTEISKDQKIMFQENGIAHIIAISGLHLSILGLLLFAFLRKFLSLSTAAGIVSVFIFLYGIFIDASATSLRAITMLYVRFMSLAIGRTYDSKNTLYIIGFIFLLLHPYLLFNAGFQFSYLAIFALNTEVKIEGKKDFKIPAVVTLNVFLFPVTIYHYFTYPLYSILLNLIVIPLMPFVLGFGILGLALSFIYLPLGRLSANIVHIIFVVYDKFCLLIDKLPYNLLWLGRPNLYEILYYFVAVFLIIYALTTLYKTQKRSKQRIPVDNMREDSYSAPLQSDLEDGQIFKYRLLNISRVVICVILLVLTILSIGIRKKNDLRMTFVSIGQGDSILVESKDTILTIDGGSTSNTSNGEYLLSPHMKSRAMNHIDYAFITHADSDHTNGILYLLENENDLAIYNLVMPINAIGDKKFNNLRLAAINRGTKITYMEEKDTLKIKENLNIKVLSPDRASLSSKKMDANEMSLTFRLDYNDHSCLFTGDIGNRMMNRMIHDDFDIENMDVDILKVPHHGSKNSNVKEFFNIVSPKYAVVSYGKNNNYGHPNAETINSILETGAKVLKTGESGQIDIYLDKEDIYYKTYK